MRSLAFVIAASFAALLFAPSPSFADAAFIARLETLLKQNPDNANLWFYLARAQAAEGNAKASVEALEKVAALGDGYLPPPGDFEKVWSDPAFQAQRAKMEAKLPRLDYAPAAFELEDRAFLPEGITYDPGSASFLVGSILQKRVVRVAPGGGGPKPFAPGVKLDAVLGLALDSPRRLLYVVSTNALTGPDEKSRRNEVVVIDLEGDVEVRRLKFPAALQLNDVAVARGGRVFVSDSGAGAIYEIPPRSGEPKLLVPAGGLPGANGLAASPDVKRLYVAHSTGVAVVNLADNSVKRMPVPARETVAAIDGLYEWQGQLIGVQNITTPGRLILMTLSADGLAISKVQTLLSHHHPSLDEPTTGVVTSHGFYLLAATGVSRMDAKGVIEKPDLVPRPVVLRIPLPR